METRTTFDSGICYEQLLKEVYNPTVTDSADNLGVRYPKFNLRFYQIINRIITIGLPRNLPCESRLDK